MLPMLLLVSGCGAARWARRRQVQVHASATAMPSKHRAKYVPFLRDDEDADAQCIVVDCTHPRATTLTHHKAHNNVVGVRASDCSTGIVLNAISVPPAQQTTALQEALHKPNITCNHFDIDAILSVWSWINRGDALKHQAVLRAAARIGDFREVLLPDLQPVSSGPAAEAVADGVIGDKDTVLQALKLCCWMNTQEKALFSAPYECKDADDKFDYFLAHLGPALQKLPPAELWQQEYDEVMRGMQSVTGGGSVSRRPDIGVTIVRAPERLHYYSLFSFSAGADVVVSVYHGRRYEVECKYTQFVNLHSRPVQPRLEMAPLAKYLNTLEAADSRLSWHCARMTDTGPVLRLEDSDCKLSKQQRYGHPKERPIYASSIAPDEFERAVVSFFEHGLRGSAPKVGGWEWSELHALNKAVDWSAWNPCLH